MCIENMLIGMRTYPKTTAIALGAGETLLLANNPSRLGLQVIVLAQSVRLQSTDGLSGNIWEVVTSTSGGFKHNVFRVETYGQLITGNIYVVGTAGGTTGFITELIGEPSTMGLILSKG